MYDRAYAIATGIFVVVALTALVLTAYWLTGTDPARRPYVIVSEYSVAGLAEGSEILYRGVPAGRVESIAIDPDDPRRVLIGILVDPQVPVQRGTYAELQQRGLTGVAQVELAHVEATEPLPTSDENPARIPMAPSLLDQASDVGTQTLEILREVARAFDDVLNEENRARLRTVATRVDGLLMSVEQVAATLESDLPPALDSATRAADSVTALAERTTASMDEVDALIAELRATSAAARDVAEELAAGGGPDLDRALEAVSNAAQDLARLARNLASNPGQLLRGPRTPPGPGEE